MDQTSPKRELSLRLILSVYFPPTQNRVSIPHRATGSCCFELTRSARERRSTLATADVDSSVKHALENDCISDPLQFDDSFGLCEQRTCRPRCRKCRHVNDDPTVTSSNRGQSF